jgi:hypothetical protein
MPMCKSNQMFPTLHAAVTILQFPLPLLVKLRLLATIDALALVATDFCNLFQNNQVIGQETHVGDPAESFRASQK